jgi:hypothetical protein
MNNNFFYFDNNLSSVFVLKLLLQIIGKYYLKFQDSKIKDNGNSVFELNIKLFVKMLIDQKLEFNKDG